ncbi:transposase family protein [Micromonospora globbae]|nr:transposase family protein [Micromonospora globbae]
MATVLSHLDRLTTEDFAVVNGKVVISAAACATMAACPDSATVSSRVHGRYRRRLADVALAGRPVVLNLCVRRFVCVKPDCRRRTFVEQVEGVTSRFTRRSQPLRRTLMAIGHALAGRAGARLSRLLGIGVSPNTMLRLIRSQCDRPSVRAPRVLGVDDFALNRATSTAPS